MYLFFFLLVLSEVVRAPPIVCPGCPDIKLSAIIFLVVSNRIAIFEKKKTNKHLHNYYQPNHFRRRLNAPYVFVSHTAAVWKYFFILLKKKLIIIIPYLSGLLAFSFGGGGNGWWTQIYIMYLSVFTQKKEMSLGGGAKFPENCCFSI